MYQLAITREFIAQHYLVGGDWGSENQKHSHHYRVEIRVEAEQLNEHGYLIDIVDLNNAASGIIERFTEKTLNDLSEFRDLNPSLERFTKIICEALTQKLALEQHLFTVKLWENEFDWAAYSIS